MAYSCAYPILHNVSVDDTGMAEYEISLDGKVIYTGRVYTPTNSAGTVEVDISPICREYLDTNFEDFPTLSGTSNKSVKTFSVDGSNYLVCYNYNTDYIFQIAEGSNLNLPITDFVDPRQYIGTSILTSGGISATHSIAGGSPGTEMIKGPHKYKVLPPCSNNFALYYVNKNGGIDYLICSGKSVEKFSTERTEARLYFDMSKRKSFGDVRFHQYISKKYELNTGWVSDSRAKNIDNLTFSPKVWIHDLQNNTITACLVDDANVSIKKFKNDKKVNYTINVTESKKYIRK